MSWHRAGLLPIRLLRHHACLILVGLLWRHHACLILVRLLWRHHACLILVSLLGRHHACLIRIWIRLIQRTPLCVGVSKTAGQDHLLDLLPFPGRHLRSEESIDIDGAGHGLDHGALAGHILRDAARRQQAAAGNQ
ncbi:MAG: hypothetical protein AB7K24_03635 [Gemmataceae bacterium]